MVPENSYDQIPYPTNAMPETHPDRLASVAVLFGMTPAPVAQCRVLEIGCGSGGNLIPMAYRLPGSSFTGIDLAEGAIAEGRRNATELGIRNVDWLAMDLRDVGPKMGEFDYILAHGLYSWIPDELRDRLLKICRERLTPQGVAFISYNALPGRHVRMMLREMAMHHTRNCTGNRERIDQARTLLRKVGETGLFATAWQPMVEEEVQRALTVNDGCFLHDDLSPINDAFYVRDFVARAGQHSLQYLGDAQPHLMFDTRAPLDWVGGGVVDREQYFDFLCLRPFRQTLLCRSEVKLQRPPGPERMDRFLFSSPARESNGRIEGLHSVCLADPPEALAQVAAILGVFYPRPLAFEQLRESVEDRAALRRLLFTLISSGFAAFHSHWPASVDGIGPRPKASRLTRWESARGGMVTYANHTMNPVDAKIRALIELLDGTRDLPTLAGALAALDGGPPGGETLMRLANFLHHMMCAGLLEA
jgi:SAM-dependent methyltransferase